MLGDRETRQKKIDFTSYICAYFNPEVVFWQSFGFRFISEDSIEEGIYSVAQEKLKLEQDVTGQGEEKGTAKKKDVARLLKVSNLLSESKSLEFINIRI